jgi:hypothetical protein
LFFPPIICLCLYSVYETRDRYDDGVDGGSDQIIHYELFFTDKWDYRTLKQLYDVRIWGELRYCFMSILRLVDDENEWPWRQWRECSSRFNPDAWNFEGPKPILDVYRIEELYHQFMESIPYPHKIGYNLDRLLEQGSNPSIQLRLSPFKIIL